MEFDIPFVDTTARVLVVDDDQHLAHLIGIWVREKWECEVVNSGADAIEKIDEGFDIVLLDRQIPDISGEEVLETIRKKSSTVQVMMVSGVEPDFDIIDLPIDDYLQKPIDRPTVQEKIEELLLRRSYHPTVEKFFVCAAKLDVLDNPRSTWKLPDIKQYVALEAEANKLRQEANVIPGQMSGYVADHYDMEGED